MKKFAFTLAETLIVIGIIGVVSALTLPNLNQSTGNKEKVAKLKKIYQNLNDAHGRAEAVYGPIDTWFSKDNNNAAYAKRYSDRILEFMKVSKNCGTNYSGCFSSANYRNVDGSDHGGGPATWDTDTKFVLADGTAASISLHDPTCSSNKPILPATDSCDGTISVDIDGMSKGSNAYGKDFFQFAITKSGIIPCGMQTGTEGADPANNCFKKGTGCAAWVIENENMDYLKCPSSLSWTNITCK